MSKLLMIVAVTPLLLASVGCQASGPPPFELGGTNWSLVGMGGQPPAQDARVTLSFARDGKVSGHAGVNQYFGTYESQKMVGGGALTMSELGTTRMAGDPAMMEQEQEYLDLLGKVTGYRADTALLELAIGNEPVLRYRVARE